MFDEISEVYPMRDGVDLNHLADMVSSVIEGGAVLLRAMGEPLITAQQIVLLRSYIKLLFSPNIQ
jgi:TetR/AcrR family transcriptional repressor of nem operon